MTLGEKIRKIRKQKGLSIMRVMELTGLSKSTISEMENDKTSPRAETLQKIAKALDVEVEMFFKADVEESPEVPTEVPTEAPSKASSPQELPVIFTTPQAAMEFILKQPTIMGFGGFDIDKMTDGEVMEFANELLRQLHLISYKYKK